MKATRVWTATIMLLASVILVAPPGLLAQSGMGTIEGKLLTASGRPISGIRVQAIDVLDPTRVYTATSDASGVFRIANVPAGSYQVATLTTNTPWMAKDATPMVDVKANATTRVNMNLVNMSQLAPASSGGGGAVAAGMSTGAIVGLAAGLAGAGLGTYAAIKASSTDDDLDALQDQVDDLQGQLDDLARQFQAFREEFDEFRRQVASEFRRR